jgi:hypothetical protein
MPLHAAANSSALALPLASPRTLSLRQVASGGGGCVRHVYQCMGLVSQGLGGGGGLNGGCWVGGVGKDSPILPPRERVYKDVSSRRSGHAHLKAEKGSSTVSSPPSVAAAASAKPRKSPGAEARPNTERMRVTYAAAERSRNGWGPGPVQGVRELRSWGGSGWASWPLEQRRARQRRAVARQWEVQHCAAATSPCPVQQLCGHLPQNPAWPGTRWLP